MSMETLSGEVSQVRHSTETSGAISGSRGRVRGSVSTSHVCTMLVGKVPITMKLPGATNLNDGDIVTVVGLRKPAGLKGIVLRNESLGTLHHSPTWVGYVLATLLLMLGIPLSFVIIGLPFLGIGIYILYLSIQQTKAIGLLRATPSPQLARG